MIKKLLILQTKYRQFCFCSVICIFIICIGKNYIRKTVQGVKLMDKNQTNTNAQNSQNNSSAQNSVNTQSEQSGKKKNKNKNK